MPSVTRGWRSVDRPADDFFSTPQWSISRALFELQTQGAVLPPAPAILDPGAGTGILGQTALALTAHGTLTSVEVSVERNEDHYLALDFLKWSTGKTHKWDPEPGVRMPQTDLRFDLIVTNPPFRLPVYDAEGNLTYVGRCKKCSSMTCKSKVRFSHVWTEWVERCKRLLKPTGHLLALGLQQFACGTGRLPWWLADVPTGEFAHSRRLSFFESGATDARDYSWYWWSRAERRPGRSWQRILLDSMEATQ